MSHTLVFGVICHIHLISKHRLIHYDLFILFLLPVMHVFHSTLLRWIYSLRLLWADSSVHVLSQVQLWFKGRNSNIPPVKGHCIHCLLHKDLALLASCLLQWPSSWAGQPDTGCTAFFFAVSKSLLPPDRRWMRNQMSLQQDDPPLNRYL